MLESLSEANVYIDEMEIEVREVSECDRMNQLIQSIWEKQVGSIPFNLFEKEYSECAVFDAKEDVVDKDGEWGVNVILELA